MRTITSLFVTLTLVLAGCSGGGDDETADDTGPTRVAALTQEQIDQVLLSEDDLPDGYTRDPDFDASDDEAAEDELLEGSPACRAVWGLGEGELEDVEPLATGENGFAAGDMGPFLFQLVEAYDTEMIEDFESEIAQFSDFLDDCPSFKSRDSDGLVMDVAITQEEFPSLGDWSLAMTWAGEMGDDTFSLDMSMRFVLVQVGHNLVMLGGMAFDDEFDLVLLEDLAQTLVERVEAA